MDDKFYPDPFTDEQVLVIDTPKGLIVVLGCTHNGLENTISEVRKAMNKNKIFGIIGGLHLCDTSHRKVRQLALWLKELQVELIACGHCTGFEAIAILYQLLGDKVSFNYVIKRIVLLICIMLDLGCDAVKQGIASDRFELAGIMGMLD